MKSEAHSCKALDEALKDLPCKVLDASGRFLYSSHKTLLKPGKYYLLGINPGGDPDSQKHRKQTVRKEVSNWRARDENAYKTEKDWLSNLSSNVLELFKALNYDIDDVCCTNWYFPRSNRKRALGSWLKENNITWKDFLPAQKAILEIVQPQVILVYGNDPYDNFTKKESGFGFVKLGSSFSGHYNQGQTDQPLKCRVARREYDQRVQVLLGFPHFSSYAFSDEERSLTQAVCITVGECLEKYLPPTTKDTGNSKIELEQVNWLKQHPIADRIMATVGSREIDDYRKYSDKKGRSEEKILNDLALLSKIFKRTIEEWEILSLQTKDIRNPFDLALPK